jgi:hypothetical protein
MNSSYQFLNFAVDRPRFAIESFILYWLCQENEVFICCLTFVMDPTVSRYLTPPSRFREATRKRVGFASKIQVEEFIKREFPNVDPSTFFSMFIWKIPAEGHRIQKGKPFCCIFMLF